MNTIDTKRIRDLVEKATKGPVKATEISSLSGEDDEFFLESSDIIIAQAMDPDDAHFVAAALNALPALLDAFDARERLREALKAQMFSTIIAMQSAGHSQADIDDCTSQARAALEGEGK